MEASESTSSFFTSIDWAIVVAYMVFTTVLGHKLSGKQSTVKDFFLGGRKLPWWAVSGSIIATEISALTFIGVPGGIFAAQGDWTYLQWGLGSIIARIAVGYWLVPLYYKKDIFSPYDFIGERLGEGVRRLVTGLFSVGAVLGQSVRVVVTAVILQAVTPLDPIACIALIGFFAVLWAIMGGMQTVIWTDVIQFLLFLFGGLLAFFWLWGNLGFERVFEANHVLIKGEAFNKMNWLDWTTPFQDPALKFTFWVGVIAMPFQNFTAYGVDQLNTQRMFCCKSVEDARKAIYFSSVSLLITVLMLAVGAGLFAWYQEFPPEGLVATDFAADKNNIFPTWIVRELPVGVSGLILSGAFAAAISSLDSILAALSQTSLSIFVGREKMEAEAGSAKMVRLSRMAVMIWGAVLTGFSMLMWQNYQANPENNNLIGLAFGMIAYTFGPLLGILLAAILPYKTNFIGLMVGTLFSVALVAWFRPELLLIVEVMGGDPMVIEKSRPSWASEWFFPINAALTYLIGLLFGLISEEQ